MERLGCRFVTSAESTTPRQPTGRSHGEARWGVTRTHPVSEALFTHGQKPPILTIAVVSTASFNACRLMAARGYLPRAQYEAQLGQLRTNPRVSDEPGAIRLRDFACGGRGAQNVRRWSTQSHTGKP